MDLAHLKNNPGARHRTKRLGCGIGSGHGKTSGRGGKGQTARTGSSIRIGFEGGQMPLYRRMPKRGFNSFTQDEYAVVSLETLNQFSDGDVVTPSVLKTKGIVRSFESGIKILGDGELKKKLTVAVSAFSRSAIQKIEATSGQCLIVRPGDALKDYHGQAPLDIKKATPAKASVPEPKVKKAKMEKSAGPKTQIPGAPKEPKASKEIKSPKEARAPKTPKEKA